MWEERRFQEEVVAGVVWFEQDLDLEWDCLVWFGWEFWRVVEFGFLRVRELECERRRELERVMEPETVLVLESVCQRRERRSYWHRSRRC